MTEKKTIGLHFGVMADPISKQLDDQGYKYSKERVAVFEKEVDAINQLRFGSNLLTESMADKIIPKLYKKIVSHVAKNNNLKVGN